MPHAHPSQSASLAVQDIRVRYGANTAVDRVDLETGPGEFVALLGPSGCGKTTLLRVIAGFVRPEHGRVIVGDADISNLSVAERRIGMVFQNYALFPHMTVAENVAYGLRAYGVPRTDQPRRTRELLGVVRMNGYEDRLPRQLSGGQQQRVALARALAISPRLLLLDEPLGALDKNLREEMQVELLRIQKEMAITAVMVTHDQEEAMAMADRIAVMDRGQIVQFDRAATIYDRPASPFVSSFVGASTLVSGTLAERGPEHWSLRTPAGCEFEFRSAGPCRRSGPAQLALRPEQLELADDGAPATVSYARTMGASVRVGVSIADGVALQVTMPRGAQADSIPIGTHVKVRVKRDVHCPVFVQP
jgi:ABC-type Fe3+/spermidine/putrescine transport system ATPase subunit